MKKVVQPRLFGTGDILGSRGAIRIALSAPLLVSYAGTLGATLDVGLLWSPFTPLSEMLDSDPE